MHGKIHDKDNKHRTFPREVLRWGGGNPESIDERFWTTGERP